MQNRTLMDSWSETGRSAAAGARAASRFWTPQSALKKIHLKKKKKSGCDTIGPDIVFFQNTALFKNKKKSVDGKGEGPQFNLAEFRKSEVVWRGIQKKSKKIIDFF